MQPPVFLAPTLRRSGTNSSTAGMRTSAAAPGSPPLLARGTTLAFGETTSAFGQVSGVQGLGAPLQSELEQTSDLLSPDFSLNAPTRPFPVSSEGLGFASQGFEHGGGTQENAPPSATTSASSSAAISSSDGLGFASQVFQYGGGTQENVPSSAPTSSSDGLGFVSQAFQYGGGTQENVPSSATTSLPATSATTSLSAGPPAGRKRKKVKVVHSPSTQARMQREKSWPDYGYLRNDDGSYVLKEGCQPVEDPEDFRGFVRLVGSIKTYETDRQEVRYTLIPVPVPARPHLHQHLCLYLHHI